MNSMVYRQLNAEKLKIIYTIKKLINYLIT